MKVSYAENFALEQKLSEINTSSPRIRKSWLKSEDSSGY